MKALRCELCGGNELEKRDGMYVCPFCNTRYTVEEAQKLIITNPILIDSSKDVENWLVLAERAYAAGNLDEANSYYRKVLEKDPNNVDALVNTIFQENFLKHEGKGITKEFLDSMKSSAALLIPQECKFQLAKRLIDCKRSEIKDSIHTVFALGMMDFQIEGSMEDTEEFAVAYDTIDNLQSFFEIIFRFNSSGKESKELDEAVCDCCKMVVRKISEEMNVEKITLLPDRYDMLSKAFTACNDFITRSDSSYVPPSLKDPKEVKRSLSKVDKITLVTGLLIFLAIILVVLIWIVSSNLHSKSTSLATLCKYSNVILGQYFPTV